LGGNAPALASIIKNHTTQLKIIMKNMTNNTVAELHTRILKNPGRAMQALLLIVAASTLGAVGAYGQSVPLPPGSIGVPLPGTTSALEPDLAGTVLADQLIPFTVFDNATGGIALTGTLQDRVVQETLTGNLDFYGRIVLTDFGNNLAAIDSIGMGSFAGFNVNANFRTDDLGMQGPDAASRSSDGSEVGWYFESPARLGAPGGASESFFFFAQTDAQNFDSNGSARIVAYSLINGGINPQVDLVGIYEPVPVPEPTTLTFAGLGGLAALVVARRRK
jgi:hypothetical protein